MIGCRIYLEARNLLSNGEGCQAQLPSGVRTTGSVMTQLNNSYKAFYLGT